MASSFEVRELFQDRLVAQAVGQEVEDVDDADPQAPAQASDLFSVREYTSAGNRSG